jgi:hypothetical protein
VDGLSLQDVETLINAIALLLLLSLSSTTFQNRITQIRAPSLQHGQLFVSHRRGLRRGILRIVVVGEIGGGRGRVVRIVESRGKAVVLVGQRRRRRRRGRRRHIRRLCFGRWRRRGGIRGLTGRRIVGKFHGKGGAGAKARRYDNGIDLAVGGLDVDGLSFRDAVGECYYGNRESSGELASFHLQPIPAFGQRTLYILRRGSSRYGRTGAVLLHERECRATAIGFEMDYRLTIGSELRRVRSIRSVMRAALSRISAAELLFGFDLSRVRIGLDLSMVNAM